MFGRSGSPQSAGLKLRFYLYYCMIQCNILCNSGCRLVCPPLGTFPIRAEMNCTEHMYDCLGPPCTSQVLLLSFVYLSAEFSSKRHITDLSLTEWSRIALKN
jgi:hypothetical protein